MMKFMEFRLFDVNEVLCKCFMYCRYTDGFYINSHNNQ